MQVKYKITHIIYKYTKKRIRENREKDNVTNLQVTQNETFVINPVYQGGGTRFDKICILGSLKA